MPESPHQRRSMRLPGYDYTQPGAYFVTLVTQNRLRLFGEIVDGEMRLNAVGEIVSQAWQWLARQYPYVDIDEWVIMPNHLHGIIWIVNNDAPGRGGSRTAPTHPIHPQKPLGRLIGAFKTVSTKQINLLNQTPGAALWQRNYFEHIIRNDDDLRRIRAYISNNPLRWTIDRENAPFQ
jgi:putative transposase